MMVRTRVGECLGRVVNILRDDRLAPPVPLNLEKATVLVVTGSNYEDSKRLKKILEIVVEKLPLAIMVCGELAREAFDAIVELLADGRFRPQVMTRIGEGISLEEAVEEFLKETWPSEDRFDDWKEYAVDREES